MEEHFNNEVVDIVSAALNKARTAPREHPDMLFRSRIEVKQAKLQYKIKGHPGPLNIHSWNCDYVEDIEVSREFYDVYIDCCRRMRKKPSEPHYVKTLLTIQFFNTILNKGWADTSFQLHISGTHTASKTHFATSTIIGRFVVGKATRRFSFLSSFDEPQDLTEAMREILNEHGNALSLMQSGDTSNLVIPYSALLDYAVNYM